MAQQGRRVVRENGRRGILTTGRSAIFNTDDQCPECCGGGNIYIGGKFTLANGVACQRVAYYDGDADQIVQLAQGIGPAFDNGTQVYTSIEYQGKMLFGGTFTTDGLGAPMPYLAEYDPGTGILASFSGGIPDGAVLDMDVRGNDLYISGLFLNLGTRIAKYNGVSWTDLSPLNDPGTINSVACSKVSNRIWCGGAWTPGLGPNFAASNSVAYTDNESNWLPLFPDSYNGIMATLKTLVDPTGFINGGNEYLCLGGNGFWIAPYVVPPFNYNAGAACFLDSATNLYFPMLYGATPQLPAQPYQSVPIIAFPGGTIWGRDFEHHADRMFMGGAFISTFVNSGFSPFGGNFIAKGYPTLPPAPQGDWGSLRAATVGGTNGDVYAIAGDSESDSTFFGGFFGAAYAVPGTLNIARYDESADNVFALDQGVNDGVTTLSSGPPI